MNITHDALSAIEHMDELANLRVPPHSIDAERCLLGAMLLDNNSIDHIEGLIDRTSFYDGSHRHIFDAIEWLVNHGNIADVITVKTRLEVTGVLDEAGGIVYLNQLAQFVPSSSHIKQYCQIVLDRAVRRKLVSAGEKISASVFANGAESTESLIDAAEKSLLGVTNSQTSKLEVKTQESELVRFFDELQIRADNPGHCMGLGTGFTDLDRVTQGFRSGDLVVLAARPSMGKTSLALNIGNHVAVNESKSVLVFSLEMTAPQITERRVSAIAKVDAQLLRAPEKMTDDEWGRVTEAGEKIKHATFDIQDESVEAIAALRRVARRQARIRGGLGMIIVDYLQLLEGKGGDENRATALGQISRSLKLLAKELNCPVIALSQLNRSVEQRPDKRPLMSDLRESGAIEQDADIIMFIYRDEYYTKEQCKEPGVAEVIIAKQRNGPTTTVKLAWLPQFSSFENLAYY